ncbi:unnamed protein product [Rhodiola kirilowii]
MLELDQLSTRARASKKINEPNSNMTFLSSSSSR